MKENTKYYCRWEIRKYSNNESYRSRQPYQIENFHHNLVLNTGANFMWKILCGGQETDDVLFDSAHAHLGVGDSSAVETQGQTDLQGTAQSFKLVESGYPEYDTNREMVFFTTFTELEANHPWNEFCLTNYSHESGTSGIVFNRKVVSKGTKVEGEIWELTLTIGVA
jgi:hypothetical protein